MNIRQKIPPPTIADIVAAIEKPAALVAAETELAEHRARRAELVLRRGQLAYRDASSTNTEMQM